MITVTADKRFLRSRVRPARRGAGMRAWLAVARVVVVLVLGGWAAYAIGTALTTADALKISKIVVRGNQRLPAHEALSLVALRGQNIFLADLELARTRLMQSPWVAAAALRKRLPASVDVVVVERRPMGIARLGGRLFLVDDRGRVFDEYGPKYAEFDLPVIDGLIARGTKQIDQRRVDLASRVVMALGVHRDTARRVSQIDVSDPADAVVLVDTDGALVRLGDDRFLERLESYLDLSQRLRERVATIDYVDMRYDNRVFVRSSGKGPSIAGRR